MASKSENGYDHLRDSAFEIIIENDGVLSDEEGGSSVASFDENSGEDIVSISDSEAMSEYAVDYATDPEDTQGDVNEQEGVGIPLFGGLDDTATADLASGRNSLSDLLFDEPVIQEMVYSAAQDIHHVEPEKMTTLAEHLHVEPPYSDLKLTVRQSMSIATLSVDEPFRVMFLGPESIREMVIAKIGGALAITALDNSVTSEDSPKGSRFNIVPISSFGGVSSPDVELVESFGVELVVEVCTSASCKLLEGREVYDLTLDGKRMVRCNMVGTTEQMEPVTWRLPHVAVVVCGENDDLHMKESRVYLRRFLSKHNIPMIIVTERSCFDKPVFESIAIDHRTLHFCLEKASGESRSPTYILKRLPVDLLTFLSLDARQLNRNLALVTGLGLETTPSNIPSSSSQVNDGVARKRATAWDAGFSGVVNGTKVRVMAIFMWLLVSILLGSAAYGGLSARSTRRVAPSDITASNSTLSMAAGSQVSTADSLATALPTLTVSKTACPPSHIGPAHPLIIDSNSILVNHSHEYEIKIIGENTILLSMPQKLLSRKDPRLTVEIRRKGALIPSDTSKLFDGVYSVHISDEEAWGSLKISVFTKTKPNYNNTFEIDFGIPWFKVSKWKFLAGQASNDFRKLAKYYQDRASRNSLHRQLTLKEITKGFVVTNVSSFQGRVLKLNSSGGKVIEAFKHQRKLLVGRAQLGAVSLWNRLSNSNIATRWK